MARYILQELKKVTDRVDEICAQQGARIDGLESHVEACHKALLEMQSEIGTLREKVASGKGPMPQSKGPRTPKPARMV